MEEEGKYTPGPWTYGKAHNYDGFYIAPKGTLPTLGAVERVDGNKMLITCHNFPGQTEANACLLAESPNLLEVGDILAKLSLQSDRYVEDMDFRDAVDNMLSVVRRARGDQ